MGNVIYTSQLICHDSLEDCKSYCKSGECVFADKCNGAANKFACLLFDFRLIAWSMFGCFILVLLICSSLVACYACRAIRAWVRWQSIHNPNREIIFNHSGRVHHVYPTTKAATPSYRSPR